MNILENYTITYQVTVLPTVIFSGMTKASEPLYFKKDLEIPKDIKGYPIECRFALYNEEGEGIDMVSEMVVANGYILKNTLNIVPLKMIEKLLSD